MQPYYQFVEMEQALCLASSPFRGVVDVVTL